MATISVVLLLAAICAACVKFGTMRIWQILLAGSLGFYLSSSKAGPVIGSALASFFNWVGSLHF